MPTYARKKTKTKIRKWPTVCSVAEAKKLVEAGAPQLTKYYWTLRGYNQKLENDLIRISAYTLKELVELYLRKMSHTKKP